MVSFTSPPLSQLLLARLAGVSLLLGACTVADSGRGTQRDSPGEAVTWDQTEAPSSAQDAPTSERTDGTAPDPEPSDEKDCTLECGTTQGCLICAGDVDCAEVRVACKPDGSCGNEIFVCASGRTYDPRKPPPDCECDIPNICRLCDDGSCAKGWSSCNADGSCFRVEWDCGPCPNSWEICDAKCNRPDEYIPSHCVVPPCDCAMYPPRCEEYCAVPDICVSCGQGCARPIVDCNDDGTCGEITYRCEHPNQTECDCPVDPICHVCNGYTCATPKIQCNSDGSCGETSWLCPDDEGHDCDVTNVACHVAIGCDEGTVPTRSGDCYGPCVAPSKCAPAPLFDCDVNNVTCERAEPDCGDNLVPTRVGYCYGTCVPSVLCK